MRGEGSSGQNDRENLIIIHSKFATLFLQSGYIMEDDRLENGAEALSHALVKGGVQAVVQEDNLSSSQPGRPDKHVTRVRVTMDKPSREQLVTESMDKLAGNLYT